MISGFFTISCLLAALMFVSIFWMNKFNNKIRTSLQTLFAPAILTVLANAFAAVCEAQWLSLLCFGLYFALTDWLAVTLLIFTQKYTGVFQEVKAAKIIVYVGCTVDTIRLIVNTFTQHMYTVDRELLSSGEYCNVLTDKTVSYYVHLIWVYLIILMVTMAMVSKIITTVKLYRQKYQGVATSLAIVLAANISYRFLHIPFDISPILYIILAAALAYFTLFYVPKELVVKLLSFSVQDINSGIICFDKDNSCVYENKTVARMLGEEKRADEFDDIKAIINPEQEIDQTKPNSWLVNMNNDEDKLYIQFEYCPLFDEKNNYIGCYIVMYDKTEDVTKLKKERFRATHDELTGIYNRRRFFEKVEREIRKSPDAMRYIAVLDVKDFKLINDLYGEKYGDEILIWISSVLKERFKFGIICGRLTADRFAVCADKNYLTEDEIMKIVGEIEGKMTSTVYKMHVHIGIYPITDSSVKVSVMCDRALLAIQKIKDSYQQTIAYYDDELNNKLHMQSIMITEFDKAIEEEQFEMFLQPQISSDGLALLGAEALVRWNHPERGMIPPGMFIESFEKSGHIYQLDMCIWRLACRQLSEWKKIGRGDLHISVNISPKDFYYVDIYKTFTELVEQYDISPEKLKLEITETAVMTNLGKNLYILDKLRDYGFQIEIDDFGSGYSSLNTLKDFKVDVLKLDMGFLRESDHNEKSRIIMKSVIDMAKNLGLTIVAEGVETEEQVGYLTNKGCDIFQGYYFSKPIPVSEFEEKYIVRGSARS